MTRNYENVRHLLNASPRAGHALSQWSLNYLEATSHLKDPRAANKLERRMRHAGFVEVDVTTMALPMCAWSNGESVREESF